MDTQIDDETGRERALTLILRLLGVLVAAALLLTTCAAGPLG